MDKLIRRLTDKVTGQPIVDAIVRARPVGDPSGVSDKNMPETPPGSGIYATADQIDHDTYKIVVNGSDSLDEYTVEAGRAKVRSGVGAFLYPLIDRIIDAKLYLSGMIGDSSATASSGDFRTAILAATASSTLRRELVLTQDSAIDSDVVVAQDLLIDLNGFSLTLNADITSVSNRITVRNGKLVVTGTGPKILSNVWTSFINIEFFGPHAEIQSSLVSYVGCTGRATLPGAENAGSIPVVAGGKHSFATASDLKLTTISTKTGSGRLTALQRWIDSWLSDVARMGILDWLLASKTKLDQWVSADQDRRDYLLSLPYNTQYEYALYEPNFQKDATSGLPTSLRRYGINCGIGLFVDGRTGVSTRVHAILTSTISTGSQARFILPATDVCDRILDFITGAVSGSATKRLILKVWAYDSNATNPGPFEQIECSAGSAILLNQTLNPREVLIDFGLISSYWTTLLIEFDVVDARSANIPSMRHLSYAQ